MSLTCALSPEITFCIFRAVFSIYPVIQICPSFSENSIASSLINEPEIGTRCRRNHFKIIFSEFAEFLIKTSLYRNIAI